MASEKQTQANKRNAKKSTGPKSAEGKEVVRYNALQHGLRAESALLLPGEDSEEFDNLAEQLRTELEPVGEIESFLVEQIITHIWRLRRATQIETGVLAWQYYKIKIKEAQAEVGRYKTSFLQELCPVEITDEQQHEQAVQKVREVAALQKTEIPTLGVTFIEMQDTFSKLTRYQTSIERSLDKSLESLRRTQERRFFTKKKM